ncbi:MAG: ribonuclease H-like domain-containing protein [Candidatus Krumholzibacteriota bacterium]|nr:ribonuclease H-like domain-containing protein [Candidatus Krumholzibacteriota bacterium]
MDEKKGDLRERLEALKIKAENVYNRSGSSGPRINDAQNVAYTPPAGEELFNTVDPSGRRELAARMSEGLSSGGRIEDLVHGQDCHVEGAAFYRIISDAGDIWRNAPAIHDEYLGVLATGSAFRIKGLETLSAIQDVDPGEICYLDIETTGLGNSPLFLIGLMYSEGERLIQDLLFARDYTEEKTVLIFLSRILQKFSVLVTFNGIRFDMPFIAERMASESIEFVPPGVHIDLLPLSRRLLGKRTPNHKLQTLERYLLGKKRTGDIPGSEIPGAYHDFVRTGEAGPIAGVIHHNRLDLLSMLEIVTVFLSAGEKAGID